VVRKAIEKMGGKVGLESEPGCGSRFWLELKAVDESRPSGNVEGPSG
jgi:signal transduction histidine kinase